jgi:hypothetical protein
MMSLWIKKLLISLSRRENGVRRLFPELACQRSTASFLKKKGT